MPKNTPKASSRAVFKVMKGNKGKDTKIELIVKKHFGKMDTIIEKTIEIFSVHLTFLSHL